MTQSSLRLSIVPPAAASETAASAEQVARLRDEFAVYVVGRGRINVAGLTPANLPHVVAAVKAVIEG